MSKVEQIEAEIGKLSPEEMRQIRDWIEDILEDDLEFTDEFKAKIERSERDMVAGKPSRTRRTPNESKQL
jgi:hypothetical protein